MDDTRNMYSQMGYQVGLIRAAMNLSQMTTTPMENATTPSAGAYHVVIDHYSSGSAIGQMFGILPYKKGPAWP